MAAGTEKQFAIEPLPWVASASTRGPFSRKSSIRKIHKPYLVADFKNGSQMKDEDTEVYVLKDMQKYNVFKVLGYHDEPDLRWMGRGGVLV